MGNYKRSAITLLNPSVLVWAVLICTSSNSGGSLSGWFCFGRSSLSQSPDFQCSEEGRLCENLIGYYDANDDESFQNVLKNGALRSMDNE
uniref:Uncharacterized protein n=1 Tax=Caenorhabditis japonica TaxID=281687 RepID=A0A8R1ESU2_CAEJA